MAPAMSTVSDKTMNTLLFISFAPLEVVKKLVVVRYRHMTPTLAIQTENLGRIYKIRGVRREKKQLRERIALRDVNLEIPRGEFFGVLGPNGAGKTTLIKILVTLLSPTTGRAIVAGYDVARAPHSVRP